MHGSKTVYSCGEPSCGGVGITACPVTFSQLSSSGSLDVATMFPTCVP